MKRLFGYKLLHYPIQTFRLLRRFLRHMPVRDVAYLILKPFMGKKKGATKAEVLSRAVEHADMKDAAAQLTQVADDMLHDVFEASAPRTPADSASGRRISRTADLRAKQIGRRRSFPRSS